MKLTIVQSVSDNGSQERVRSSSLSIDARLCSRSFPSMNLNVVSSEIPTVPLCESTFLMYVIQVDK